MSNSPTNDIDFTSQPAVDFSRDICGDPLQSSTREWLVTNGIGGYGCGTLSGVLTRCYHGLLVAALNPPLDRTLLLTKLDEVVQYLDTSYPLSCDRWTGGTTTGHGYRHLEHFHLEGTIPTWTYTCADAVLEKRIWMQPGENTTYIQYKLLRATAPFHLSTKALINHRNHHHVTQSQHNSQHSQKQQTQNPPWEILTRSHPRGLKIEASGCPSPIYLFSTKGQLQPVNRWYQHYFLTQEKYRGLLHIDDHFHCATLRTLLTPGETLTVAASTEPYPNLDDKALLTRRRYEQDLLDQSNKPSPKIQQLLLAADQFIATRTTTDPQTKETIGKNRHRWLPLVR